MRAMVLGGPGAPLQATELERPTPGHGQLLLRVLACGVCRTDLHIVDGELTATEAPARARSPDRRSSRGRTTPRRAVARLDVRCVPFLHERAREPVRSGALHRLRPRRRLRRVGRRRRALLLPDPGRLRRPRGCAAPLRGTDRLPRTPARRRRRATRAVRLRFGRSHRRAGRPRRGTARLRDHARRRRGRPRVRAVARRRVGRPDGPPEELDAAIIFAPVGRARPRRAAPRLRRAAWSSAPASTCPTSPRSPTSSCGASGRSARWRT